MKEDNKYLHGFKVPEEYFDTLEESLIYGIMEDTLPAHHGFSVPENYFDRLEEALTITLVETESTAKGKIVPLWRNRWVYGVGIAASLLLAWIYISPSNSTTLEELPMASVEQYIQNGNIDLEWYDVAQLLSDSDLEDFSSGLHFEEEQLESYLMDHLDESTLFQE